MWGVEHREHGKSNGVLTKVLDSGQDCARPGDGRPYCPVVVGVLAPPPAFRLIVGHFSASRTIIIDGPGGGTMSPLGQHLGGRRRLAPATGPVSWVTSATPLSLLPNARDVIGIVVVGIIVGVVGAIVGVVVIVVPQSVVLVTQVVLVHGVDPGAGNCVRSLVVGAGDGAPSCVGSCRPPTRAPRS